MSDESLLSHLDAAHNLARWLMGNPADAEDVVQEAYLRALAGADRFRGGDERAWLLSIVRNGCYSSHRRQRVRQAEDFDETRHGDPTRHAVARATRHRARHEPTRAVGGRASGAGVPGSDRAAGVRRPVLQGDRRCGGGARRHRHVPVVAGARAVAGGAGRGRRTTMTCDGRRASRRRVRRWRAGTRARARTRGPCGRHARRAPPGWTGSARVKHARCGRRPISARLRRWPRAFARPSAAAATSPRRAGCHPAAPAPLVAMAHSAREPRGRRRSRSSGCCTSARPVADEATTRGRDRGTRAIADGRPSDRRGLDRIGTP